uniref:Uncharacterized protein n=1 Tax=viral metagenome TaxID=1070528 RepID=A0A6M3IMQ6_9ZZZZ
MKSILRKKTEASELVSINNDTQKTDNNNNLIEVYDKLQKYVEKKDFKTDSTFEFDKLDCLNEAMAVIQEKINAGERIENLTEYAYKVFYHVRKNYYRKYVKPRNEDVCFIEFNTDKLILMDENNPDTNYFDAEYLNRRQYIQSILKFKTVKIKTKVTFNNKTQKERKIKPARFIQTVKSLTVYEKKLFALYHCKEFKQSELSDKFKVSKQVISYQIKRLNQKIEAICKQLKIDTLIDPRYCIPGVIPKDAKGTPQTYDQTPSACLDISNLPSQSNRIEKKDKSINIDMENYLKTKLEIEKEDKEDTEKEKLFEIKQDGFFGNCVNGARLLNMFDSNNLPYASDSFNAFYSKKSFFGVSNTMVKIKPSQIQIKGKIKKTYTGGYYDLSDLNLDNRLFEIKLISKRAPGIPAVWQAMEK